MIISDFISENGIAKPVPVLNEEVVLSQPEIFQHHPITGSRMLATADEEKHVVPCGICAYECIDFTHDVLFPHTSDFPEVTRLSRRA